MTATTPFMFLLKLAWDCRYRLPLLITIGFMVLDIRMQLDVNIQMRRVPNPPRALDDHEDYDSDDSWETLESEESETF